MKVCSRPALVRTRTSTGDGRVRGFTLIEVLVAIALVAILAGMVVGGSGMVGTARLRQGAAFLVSCIRMASSRSTATGLPVRLGFDLEQHTVQLEQGQGEMLRVKETDDKKDESEGAAAGARPASSAEQEAQEYADSLVKSPHAPRAKFIAVPNFADDPAGHPIAAGIQYRSVQTEHDNKPRTNGHAYLYFWPGGETERAVIQVCSGPNSKTVLSVIVNPLTGKARIERGEVPFEDPRHETDFGQREEE